MRPRACSTRSSSRWRPGVGSIERTPGRTGEPTTEEFGYLHCGPAGAGHFVKMVHNGIEYGLMAAYAEGLNILHKANFGKEQQAHDAETAPVPGAERNYAYDLDTTAITEVWRRGSVVASWLLDLTAIALVESPELEEFRGRVSDSGEGRWTVDAAIDEGVPGLHAERGAVHPLQLARERRVRRQAALGDAQAVRRSRREGQVALSCVGGDLALALLRPERVEAAWLVGAPVGVGAEVVAQALDQ